MIFFIISQKMTRLFFVASSSKARTMRDDAAGSLLSRNPAFNAQF